MATEAPLPAGLSQDYDASFIQNINDGAFDVARKHAITLYLNQLTRFSPFGQYYHLQIP